MFNMIMAFVSIFNEVSEAIFGRRWRYVGIISYVVGLLISMVMIVIWVKFGFMVMLKVYMITIIASIPIYILDFIKLHKWMKETDN